ncbi:MAG: hypothetical protein V4683_14100 [Bacteroidota bacterium]
MFIISCQRENQIPKIKKEIFKESVAVGLPIIKEIDQKGGVIEIALSESRVSFNPNSVSKNTTVSIQPISNPLSNFGLGIRLASHYSNIKIELKYPQNGLSPNTFDIYYAQGIEWIKAENKILDTVNHTISIVQQPTSKAKINSSARVTTHFYDYIIGK